MTEIEVPLEKVHEDIHHAAHQAGDPDSKSFMNRAALLSAFLAVLAAVSALFAGHFANDAMIEQIQSSDHWSFYQAKGIKMAIAELHQESAPSEKTAEKIQRYKEEQSEIKREADKKAAESKEHLHKHESLAASVTLFQIAIALTAIAVLTRKKSFLVLAAGIGAVSFLWMIKSFLL